MLRGQEESGGNNSVAVNADAFLDSVHPTYELLSRILLVSMHGGTFLTLCFYLYIMYSKVQIAHPMFAVLFQELGVLCLLQTCSFLSILFSGIHYRNAKLPIFFHILGLQLHQWSWVTISLLRFDWLT